MIKELVQLVKHVPDLIKERAMEPKAGLHILIRFDDEGNASIVNGERCLGKKHGETSSFLKSCASKQEAGWMIDTNKCFDLPTKGIHTASPYCVGFKLAMLKEDKNDKSKSKDLASSPPSIEYKIAIATSVVGRLHSYFEKCFDSKFGLDESEKQKAIQFKNYLKDQLSSILAREADSGWGDYAIIYRDEPLDKYRTFQEIYLADGLFNTAEYNLEIAGETLGTSNFYNGFNSKKPFLTHQTASFDITSRISANEAKALADFKAYARKKLFPNPIPIFIDEPELTEEAIHLYHRSEDQNISHREIISELWKRKEDLGNYYLLYFSVGEIRDFDFVSKFQYYLSNEKNAEGDRKSWVIENVMGITESKTTQPPITMKSVFDFERIVIRQLFNNALVKIDEKKREISMRYFDDMDPKYYRAALYTLLLKYRKTVYDFIYKSMRMGIGLQQFEDICLTGIIDDLKENREYGIKAKLNIYFSLYQYFKSDKNKNLEIMPSKIDEHKTLLVQIVDNEATHFSSDEVYAFGAGQLIYYLLSQSEAGERTHAVLEPFLQKTNYAHFNDALAAILLKYKHAVSFDFKRFNQLAAEVLDYRPDKGLQELRPTLLAGYFCPNVLYQKKSETDNLNLKTILQ